MSGKSYISYLIRTKGGRRVEIISRGNYTQMSDLRLEFRSVGLDAGLQVQDVVEGSAEDNRLWNRLVDQRQARTARYQEFAKTHGISAQDAEIKVTGVKLDGVRDRV